MAGSGTRVRRDRDALHPQALVVLLSVESVLSRPQHAPLWPLLSVPFVQVQPIQLPELVFTTPEGITFLVEFVDRNPGPNRDTRRMLR